MPTKKVASHRAGRVRTSPRVETSGAVHVVEVPAVPHRPAVEGERGGQHDDRPEDAADDGDGRQVEDADRALEAQADGDDLHDDGSQQRDAEGEDARGQHVLAEHGVAAGSRA
jgi:hypothetical protein